jgi:hypothetical protein
LTIITETMTTLQTLLDVISYYALPFEWATFDFAAFSRSKRLWDHVRGMLAGLTEPIEVSE